MTLRPKAQQPAVGPPTGHSSVSPPMGRRRAKWAWWSRAARGRRGIQKMDPRLRRGWPLLPWQWQTRPGLPVGLRRARPKASMLVVMPTNESATFCSV